MLKETAVCEQAEQLNSIINMLLAMLGTIGGAFVHQQSKALDDIGNQHQNLVEEIAFAAAKADEQMVGKSLIDRKPFIRYQSMLIHLKMITEVLASLAEALRNQITEGIPFSDKAIDQTNFLFARQEMILRTLAEIIETGNGELLKVVGKACRELARSCLQFATGHESRLVEGLCLPAAAPIFLTILDRTQTAIHHELEMDCLLANWKGARSSGTGEDVSR